MLLLIYYLKIKKDVTLKKSILISGLIFKTTLLRATCFIDRAAAHLSQISPTEIKPLRQEPLLH